MIFLIYSYYIFYFTTIVRILIFIKKKYTSKPVCDSSKTSSKFLSTYSNTK